MKDIYICSGQFHLFCSILLKKEDNKNRKGDLLICDCFEGARDIFKKLKLSEGNNRVFDQVYLLNKRRYDHMLVDFPTTNRGKIRRLIYDHTAKLRNTLKGITDTHYSRIYIAGAIPALIEYCIFSHKKYGTEILLFDDGLGPRIQWEDPTLRKRIIDYNRYCSFFRIPKVKFFFSPDRVCDMFPHIKVEKQLKPKKTELKEKEYLDMLECINNAYSYEKSQDIALDHDIIYYSAGYDIYDHLKEFSEQEINIIDFIGKNSKNAAVKRHPDSNEKYSSCISILSSTYIPELTCLNNEIEDKLLVTTSSTAVFNPSFIFDSNPYVLLTYKLFDKPEVFAEKVFQCSIEELDRRIRRTLYKGYRDKTKIYIPENFEELKNAVVDYRTRTGR